MKTTNEWLDAVKSQHGIESDYRLAKVLGVATQNVTNWRTGRNGMDAYTAAKVAELLNVDALKVIASAEAERARNDEKRSFWRKLAACVLIGTATAGGAGTPSPAQASGSSPMYIMLSQLRRLLAGPAANDVAF